MSTSVFRSAQAYVEQLPNGLQSFSQCYASSRLPRAMLREFPHLLKHPELPETWRVLFTALLGVHDVGWFPEVHNVLLNHLIRDAYFPSDESFLVRNKERIVASFSSPLMRSLMRLTTPHLLVLGATHRWSNYHRGTELKIDAHEALGCRGRLLYPHGLFSPLMLGDTRVALEASVEMTRHNVSHASVASVTGGTASFTLGWDASTPNSSKN